MDKIGFRIDDRAREDAAMLVYVLPHSDTCNKIHVLDCQGDVNLLEDVDAQIQEIGLGQWLDVVYPTYITTDILHHTKIFNKNVLNHKFVNYRAVDPLHIDKLMAIRKQEIDYSTRAFDGVNKCHFIDGITVLPGNFIIARAHNKVIDNPGFDMELGTKMVTNLLGTQARDKLFELEGYRLFRTLNTLDSFISPIEHGKDINAIPNCIANSAPYVDTSTGTVYVVPQCQSQGKELACDRLIPGAYYVPATAKRVIETYLRSYIEVR